MSDREYKTLPLSEEDIEQMRTKTPGLYKDMVEKYGIENVINNYLVPYVVLTEDQQVVGKHGNVLNVTPELIRSVCKSANSSFHRFMKDPINKAKSWVSGVTQLGYTPINTNHDLNNVENRHGFIIGDSYKVMQDETGRLCLVAEGLLISPESKANYIQGKWREVSPTIMKDHSISELSYVNVPAQETNSSLSSGKEPLMANDIVIQELREAPEEDFDTQLAKAKFQMEEEKRNNEQRQKEATVNRHVNGLLKRGIIPSAKKEQFTDVLLQLSSGEIPLVANAMQQIKGLSPLNNRPRQVFIKGEFKMPPKSKEEAWLEFDKANALYFPELNIRQAAFEKDYQGKLASFSAPSVGEIKEPFDELLSQLSMMDANGGLSDEHRAKLSAYCGQTTAKLSMPEDDQDGDMASMAADATSSDGKIVESGGVEDPNNTKLSSPDSAPSTEATDGYRELLERGYADMKKEHASMKAELDEIKAKMAPHFKQ